METEREYTSYRQNLVPQNKAANSLTSLYLEYGRQRNQKGDNKSKKEGPKFECKGFWNRLPQGNGKWKTETLKVRGMYDISSKKWYKQDKKVHLCLNKHKRMKQKDEKVLSLTHLK